MRGSLLISVRFHEGRYHGAGDWPPSPARLFQALVAGAARGAMLAEKDMSALVWLEKLDPPIISAPRMRAGQGFRNFVPNNDLDAVGGDLRLLGEIRTPKQIRPILFNAEVPLLYLWAFDDSPDTQFQGLRVCAIAERLYQLGRGVDMAWAWAEIVARDEAEARLAKHGGCVHRPDKAGGRATLAVPIAGSLSSLVDRHMETRGRFQTLFEARPTRREPERQLAKGLVLKQPRKPRFRMTAYDSPPVHLLFDISSIEVGRSEAEFAPWPLARAVDLVTIARDHAASRLRQHSPDKWSLIERMLIGRGATEADKTARVRIVPLPSVGHAYADHAIRRVLVEVPPNCRLSAADIRWAFSVELEVDHRTGEIWSELVPASDDSMLGQYGVGHPARIWRTVTPAVPPQAAVRHRTRHRSVERGGLARIAGEAGAAEAVVQAIRHAGIEPGVVAIRVQREPFSGNGDRAEAFAYGTRFAAERLWHVEVTFGQPQHGPLIIGDGRYLGLGLMQPVFEARRDVAIFALAGEPHIASCNLTAFLSAVRRALMSLARHDGGTLPRLFSGHEPDGRPAQSGRHEHVFLSGADMDGDGFLDRLIVTAPWRCDRSARSTHDDAALFDRVVGLLEQVRAGRLGIISMMINPAEAEDWRLVGPARIWESHTSYCPTRPVRREDDPAEVLRLDARTECRRRGLPMPWVTVLEGPESADPCSGSRLRLSFAAAVSGPLILGRNSHQGGGLFLAVS